ncbi:class I SAM-dependent methyltransferase [Pseudonocardia oceani]|nr:class I SAM-dependent methyltransferase [Pseudonocardia oceani]
MEQAEMIAANRANWDARVPVHLDGGYDLDALRAGQQRLADFEYAAVDVRDRDVLHLQCHIGTDTICLARHGARAVGLDLSPASVAAARGLAAECGVDVEYVAAAVDDAVDALGGRRFDVVYTGKGALCWLPDLTAWARVVADLLRPGGVLHVVEFHPLMNAAADEQSWPEVVLDWPYLPSGAIRVESAESYAGSGELEAPVSYEWTHGIGTVIGAVTGAGLRLTSFAEHDVSPWRRWPDMAAAGDGWWTWPGGVPRLPLLYSLRAQAPGWTSTSRRA